MSWDLPSPFIHERVAHHTEIDGYGHVNNVVYVAWMDDCAWAHSTERGIPPELCRTLNRGMAVWRTQVHYLGSAYEGDAIQVATWPVLNDAHRAPLPDPSQGGRPDAGAGPDPLRLHRPQDGQGETDAPRVHEIHRGARRGRGGSPGNRALPAGRRAALSGLHAITGGHDMHDQWSGPELDSLIGKTALTRREMMMTTLAVGFAAATLPVHAETVITTSADGLTAGEVKIPVADGEIPAYRAMPAKGSAFPLVLVVQEIFGVHEHIKDVCRRFAKEGYCAIAPEMYARQGDVSKLTDYREIFAQVVSKVPDAQVMSDLDAAVAWAAKTDSGDPARVAVTGFCWGGRITWLYAAHNPKLKAGVAWYGRLVGQPTELQPRYPVDVAAELKAPVLGLYGEKDQGIPLEDVEKMRSALAAAKQPSEIVVFPEAPHGFHADYRPSFREAAAKDAWAQCLAWFRKHGVG